MIARALSWPVRILALAAAANEPHRHQLVKTPGKNGQVVVRCTVEGCNYSYIEHGTGPRK